MLLQVETDYKAECMAGDTIESLACRVKEDTNGTGIIRRGLSLSPIHHTHNLYGCAPAML